MAKKKFRHSKIGIFLKEKAPHILDVVGDVLPDKGALGIVKNIIDRDNTLDNNDKVFIKREVQKVIYEQVFNTDKNMKSILTSKKFYYAVAGVIAVLVAGNSGLSEGAVTETIVSIAVIVTALITGQGLADLGKEKEKLK